VIDGDTVVLDSLGRTRLIGVDTPEVYFRTECYGRRDRFGRALAYLYKGDVFINAELVQGGYAVPLTIPPNVRYADHFARLARQARASERGLWAPDTCAGDADRAANSRGTGESAGGRSWGSNGSSSSSRSPRSGGSSGLDVSRDRNCSSFSAQAEAQKYFEAKGGPASDPDHLDGDHDGVACQSLP